MQHTDSGYAPVNGTNLYWESYGEAVTAVLLVHGGFGLISMLDRVIEKLARNHRVIAIELQGHGHTGDIDRPFTYEGFGDDIAAVVDHLQLQRAHMVGYSLGAGAALRTALQHPNQVGKVVVGSFPFCRDGWYPEVLAAFDAMGSGLLEHMRHAPLYDAWLAVAPDPDSFPALMDKTGELQRRPYDWSDEIRVLEPSCMLMYADADSIPPHHIADFYAMLGGEAGDAGVDGSGRSKHRLAIVPGTTHYDLFQQPCVGQLINDFLGPD